MIKTLRTILQQDKVSFVVPRSVQQTIPIRRIWPDGIFLVDNKFSMSWKFSDINYEVASDEDRESMYKGYCELLNSLDVGATTKITLCNRRINRDVFARDSLIPLAGDAYDEYRKEYNQMLLDRATTSSSMMQERYITVSVARKNIEEARVYFRRIDADLTARFSRLGSKCEVMNMDERLNVLHDFYRAGNEIDYKFDYREALRRGHHFADTICPDSMEHHADHLMLGEKYVRAMFCQTYPSFLLDKTVRELAALPTNLMLSIDIIPVATDEAVREAETKLLGAETNITNWQRKQNQNNNFSAVVPYDLEEQRREMREMLNDLRARDQRLMFAVVTFVHMADSKKQLDADTESLKALGRQRSCQFTTLRYQQLDGLNTALPFGVRKIDTFRTLITEAAGALMPFSAQEVVHKNGIYHGLSPVNKNMIFVNRRQLLNGNGCILGVSGSGKSFFGKLEIVPLMLKGGVDIMIIDPEAEYMALTQQLGGEIIHISATSPHHVNVMDMAKGYGAEDKPLVMKSQFIQSLFEQIHMSNNLIATPQSAQVEGKQKSIIDRCLKIVYKEYLDSDFTVQPPTLKDLHAVLLQQPEPEAQALALDLELYAVGSMNTFAQQTNVNLEASLIAFEIRDLGSSMQPLGMLVILDAIYNRLLKNQQRGRETWIFVDEAYLLFRSPHSAEFFFKLWKRIRKQNGFATAITQNVSELLESPVARSMLTNSEYLVLLNQSAQDREILSSVLKIPDAQLSYAVNVPQGQGVLKCGSYIVPFEDKFPTDTKLYRLMTTKPSDLYSPDQEEEPHDQPTD